MEKEELEINKTKFWNSLNYSNSKFGCSRGKIENIMEKQAIKKAIGDKYYPLTLDVGIGDGRLIETYFGNIGHLKGIDISIEQLKVADGVCRDLGISYNLEICGDGSKLKDFSNKFDLVICTRVLQHLHNQKDGIREFSRVLKERGDLLLLLYNRFSIFGLKKLYENKFVSKYKGRFQNPIGIYKILKENNFDIVYYSGALLGQPELFGNNITKRQERFIRGLEMLSNKFPFKYISGRQVIVATKKNG